MDAPEAARPEFPQAGPVLPVAVVGLGYVGLPTAVCLATGGLEVTGVDVSAAVVEQVSRGEARFAEPGPRWTVVATWPAGSAEQITGPDGANGAATSTPTSTCGTSSRYSITLQPGLGSPSRARPA